MHMCWLSCGVCRADIGDGFNLHMPFGIPLTLKNPGADMACIPSILIKTSQFFFGENCLISALTKKFFGKLRF